MYTNSYGFDPWDQRSVCASGLGLIGLARDAIVSEIDAENYMNDLTVRQVCTTASPATTSPTPPLTSSISLGKDSMANLFIRKDSTASRMERARVAIITPSSPMARTVVVLSEVDEESAAEAQDGVEVVGAARAAIMPGLVRAEAMVGATVVGEAVVQTSRTVRSSVDFPAFVGRDSIPTLRTHVVRRAASRRHIQATPDHDARATSR